MDRELCPGEQGPFTSGPDLPDLRDELVEQLRLFRETFQMMLEAGRELVARAADVTFQGPSRAAVEEALPFLEHRIRNLDDALAALETTDGVDLMAGFEGVRLEDLAALTLRIGRDGKTRVLGPEGETLAVLPAAEVDDGAVVTPAVGDPPQRVSAPPSWVETGGLWELILDGETIAAVFFADQLTRARLGVGEGWVLRARWAGRSAEVGEFWTAIAARQAAVLWLTNEGAPAPAEAS